MTTAVSSSTRVNERNSRIKRRLERRRALQTVDAKTAERLFEPGAETRVARPARTGSSHCRKATKCSWVFSVRSASSSGSSSVLGRYKAPRSA